MLKHSRPCCGKGESSGREPDDGKGAAVEPAGMLIDASNAGRNSKERVGAAVGLLPTVEGEGVSASTSASVAAVGVAASCARHNAGSARSSMSRRLTRIVERGRVDAQRGLRLRRSKGSLHAVRTRTIPLTVDAVALAQSQSSLDGG